MDPKFLTSSTSWALFLWGTLQNHGHKMAAGATVFRDTLISVIPAGFRVVADGGVIRGSLISVILAGVPLTSRKWRRSRRQTHPPQRRIPYSGGCSRHVTDITSNPGDGAIRHSVISLILSPVTYRKSRSCRRQLRVPTPSVLHCR